MPNISLFFALFSKILLKKGLSIMKTSIKLSIIINDDFVALFGKKC